MIRLEGVTVTFRSRDGIETKALDGVNLSVPRGRYAALIGPNGSGKTTIAKVVKGIISPDSGTVTIHDEMLSPGALAGDVGLVFSNPENQIVSAVVEEDIAFGLENQGVEMFRMHEMVAEIMERLDIAHLAKMLPHNLSGGEQQRLVIAGVLVMGLDIIVFDEATSMLDVSGRRDILNLIRRLNNVEGMTVLSITHSLAEAILADEVHVIHGGKMVFHGTPGDLLHSQDVLDDIGFTLSEFPGLVRGLIDAGVPLSSGNITIDIVAETLSRLHTGG
ncbi:MAG: ATP-binding cassette domain-containing protein [Deltaproteobacteria bacterium]|nr:ATP-binding cassette domain-containing protein [Candidatus Zymogenaceae bacterium]